MSRRTDSMEGFVVRNTNNFNIDAYAKNVAKFVGEWYFPVAGNVARNGIA